MLKKVIYSVGVLLFLLIGYFILIVHSEIKYWQTYGNQEGWESLGAIELIDTLQINNTHEFMFRPQKSGFYYLYIGFPNSKADNKCLSDSFIEHLQKQYEGLELIFYDNNDVILFENKIESKDYILNRLEGFASLVNCGQDTKYNFNIPFAQELTKGREYKFLLKINNQIDLDNEYSNSIFIVTSGLPGSL